MELKSWYPWYLLAHLELVEGDNCPIYFWGWHMVNAVGSLGGFTTACGETINADFAKRQRNTTPEAILAGEIQVCPACLAVTLNDPRFFRCGIGKYAEVKNKRIRHNPPRSRRKKR